jgi:hypothetical protein
MKSDNNKFLKVRKLVKLTDTIDVAISLLDGYFEQANLRCEVTSGLRTAEYQLKLIVDKCYLHHIDKEFPLVRVAKLLDLETWVKPWGRLLEIGEMINPPVPTKVPFDYIKSNGDKRKAGTLIPLSGHQLGQDFDIGGRNLELNTKIDLNKIGDVIKTFMNNIASKNIVSGYLIEGVNGAVHVDCIELKLDKF